MHRIGSHSSILAAAGIVLTGCVSSRRGENTEVLLKEALREAQENGANFIFSRLRLIEPQFLWPG